MARWASALCLLGAVCCAPGVALAQYRNEAGIGAPGAGPAPTGWDAVLGLGLAIAPRYPGSDAYRLWPVPMIMVRYQDLFFIGPMGAGLNLIKWNGWRAGPLIGAQYRRYESDDPHLNGLGDIPLSLTAGGFVSYTQGPFEIAASARQAIVHTQNGLTGRLGMNLRVPFASGTYVLTLGPELDFANREYTQTWYGVTPVQSAYSGLPVYSPHGGLRDVGFNSTLLYRYSEHILFRTFLDFREFAGDVADSPIVFGKSQIQVGAGAAYRF